MVAGYGRAFGMTVLAWGRAGSLARAQADGFETAASPEELLARSDALSLHVKLTPDTRGHYNSTHLGSDQTPPREERP